MKDILTNEVKRFVVVKVNSKGEYVGVLTRRTTKYGNAVAISPFTLENLSYAIKDDDASVLQVELDSFVLSKKTYTYDDFRIVEMESKTTVTFGKEVEISDEKFRIVNNTREMTRLAKEWGKEWRKANPNVDGWVWEGAPYNSVLKVNPLATDYFQKELTKLKTDLKWEMFKDYASFAEREAYDAFVKAARL